MKNIFLMLLLASPAVFASPQQELSDRLSSTRGFTANFNQTVTSPEGEVINKSEGDIAMRRPNLFRWETKKPDENLLLSDGITLWYYNPFVEQVTAMWTKDAAEQTPFVLLSRNNPKDWERYEIQQQGNEFTLIPKVQTNMGKFMVNVADNGTISMFTIVEQDGQKSHFTLNDFKVELPNSSLFKFTLPKGVELDDQRQ